MQALQGRAAGSFVEDALDAALARAPLSGADRRLCQELAYGVVRWQATLDWLIARKTPDRRQKPLLQNVLRLGLYQIFWLSRIPHHAAVDESVQMARRGGFNTQAGFVNAVLRGYVRELEPTRRLLDELKTTQPHLGYSHPQWLADRWRERWGAEAAAKLMTWNNTPPKTFARVNTLKTEPGKLLEQWRAEGVEYDFVRQGWLEENLVFELKAHPALTRLPSFQQGLFYVQDPGTLLAASELAPRPGERVLDFCAAPGGKLGYMAQLMRNEGRLVAHDITPERLKLVQENSTRLGITCAETCLASLGAEHFDRVMLDAPCSNTGVMRRRVDLRWRITAEEIQRLRLMQLELLRRVAPLLRRGGTLVYSTCSLETEENEEPVKQFLLEHAQFNLERTRELLPFRDGVDGAFVARLRRSD